MRTEFESVTEQELGDYPRDEMWMLAMWFYGFVSARRGDAARARAVSLSFQKLMRFLNVPG